MGLVQGVLPLLDYLTPEGIAAPSHLNLPSTRRWLGPNSFPCQPGTKPWIRLLQHAPCSHITQGLSTAWLAMQEESVELILELDRYDTPADLLKTMSSQRGSPAPTPCVRCR